MVELKPKFKNNEDSKEVNNEVKQEFKKSDSNSLNLIDIYMGISLYMFPNKNIKIRNINKE